MKLFAVLALFSCWGTSAVAGWDQTVLDVSTGERIGWMELGRAIAGADLIVLGEKHQTEAVQKNQARVIRVVVKERHAEDQFVLGWEFLTASLQSQIQYAFARYASGKLSGEEFLKLTQGGERANASYLPILETVRDLGGSIRAVNLSREEKAPVVQGGITAANPSVVPEGFALGSAGYHERFVATMGQGHATPEQMENYFAAQCLTDDVMAYRLIQGAGGDPRFLVVGGFHTDYRDGVVARLKARAGWYDVRVVRFIDASDYTEAELKSLPRDPQYGPLADYIVFSGEPQ